MNLINSILAFIRRLTQSPYQPADNHTKPLPVATKPTNPAAGPIAPTTPASTPPGQSSGAGAAQDGPAQGSAQRKTFITRAPTKTE